MKLDIMNLPRVERLAWYADDIMKVESAIDDVMMQIDQDEPRETIQRNLRVLMLALQSVADDIGRDVIATREEKKG